MTFANANLRYLGDSFVTQAVLRYGFARYGTARAEQGMSWILQFGHI